MIIPSDISNSLNTAFLLTASGNNEKIRQGTQLLMQLRQEVMYPKVLLDYFTSNVDASSALRAAIEFKLWFQQYKNYADFEYNVVAQTVEVIKQSIIPVYLQCSKQLAHMVQDAILSIAQRDFPNNWQNLMSQLVPVLDINTYSLDLALRVLKLFRKLFAKYEYSSRSDPLYLEIIHVCDTSHDALFKLAITLINSIQQPTDTTLHFKLLKSLLRVFYFLNFQDLHPKFEDNLQSWMSIMRSVLQIQGRQAFRCKGEALRSVLLYATKYREDFEGLIQVFSQEIWTVCTQNSSENDPEYDKIVHNALRYFKSLVAWTEMRQFFETSMPSLMEHLIMRNLSLNKNDFVNFEEEPLQFIEAYFENSDIESRRAQTVELYKSLCRHYKDIATNILQNYMQQFTAASDKVVDPNTEILIINLIIDGLVTAYTSKDGAVDIQLDRQLPLYYYQQVLKKRLADIYQLEQSGQQIDTIVPAIVLAFYCRFLFVYRNILPQNEVLSIAQVLSKILILSRSLTLQKVVFYTIEALLTIQTGDFKTYTNRAPLFTKDNVGDQCIPILNDIYTYIGNLDKIEQYAIRAMTITIQLNKESSQQSVEATGILFEKLLIKLQAGFDFSHVLLVFESIGSFLLNAINSNNTQTGLTLATQLLNQLDSMLRENKGDICTFILQIYSLFVRLIPSTNIQLNEYFEGIVRNFLQIENWSEANQSLFPAYVILLEGWLKTRPLTQEDCQLLQNILQGFTLLSETLMSLQGGQIWIPVVLNQIFKQYQVNLDFLSLTQQQSYSKTKQGSIQQRMINKEAFLVLSHICLKFGVVVLLDECYKIQPGLLENFLVNEIVIVKSIQNHIERRKIFTMLTQILFDGQMKLPQQCWQILFQSIVENFTMKRKTALRFLLRENIQQIPTSSSGFQRLNALQQLRDKQQPLIDEEKYFGQKFKIFYSDPMVQQQLNIASLINTQQQEMLTQIIQNA